VDINDALRDRFLYEGAAEPCDHLYMGSAFRKWM
jgi:hypothetical protein